MIARLRRLWWRLTLPHEVRVELAASMRRHPAGGSW
jgi:hypothetical protein